MIFVSEMADDRPCWPSQKKEVEVAFSRITPQVVPGWRVQHCESWFSSLWCLAAWHAVEPNSAAASIRETSEFAPQEMVGTDLWHEAVWRSNRFFPRNSKAPRYPYAPWCWYIYLQNWVIFGANVGKYTSTMDPMGILEVSGSRIHHIPSPWGLWNSGCKVSHLIGIYWTYHIYLLENYWHFNI
jgi:hypothetical protein